MKQELDKKINFTEGLLIEVKEIILDKMSKGFDINRKLSTNEFVTDVDIEIEEFIKKRISSKYKEQKFLGEEKSKTDSFSGQLWIIDPIDGTSNFVNQGKDFSVSIAYYEDKEPVFGYVYDIMADEMFLGIKGEGAFLNGKKLESQEKVIEFDDVIFGGRFIVFDFLDLDIVKFHNMISGHRNISSSALEICHVASGRLHMYVSQGLRIWDIAAANIILNEVSGHWKFGNDVDHLTLVDRKERYYSACNETLFEFLMDRVIE